MTVSTITDELRLFTQKKGKVIALALKDRGAVLPGGHMANAAYRIMVVWKAIGFSS